MSRNSRNKSLGMTLVFIMALVATARHALATQTIWNVDNTTDIGGITTTQLGSPAVVSTPYGNGLKFDGTDGVIVKDNPIANLTAFTVEMVFRPDPIVNSTSNMPRILHIQSPNPPDDRITLEARIEDDQYWHTDAFLKVGAVSDTFEATTAQHHLLGQWYDYAMVYDGTTESVYVNGVLEHSALISVPGLAAGEVSLGMRDNEVDFFEGEIAEVRFTTSALSPSQLLSVPEPASLGLLALPLLTLSRRRGRSKR